MKNLMMLGILMFSVSAMACAKDLCHGDRVLYSSEKNDTGSVNEIFNNGLVQIKWDNYSAMSAVKSSELSRSTTCYNKICLESRVIFANAKGDAGKVVEVFANGKIRVDWDDFTNESIVNASELSLGYSCNGNLCVGDKVIFNNAALDIGIVVAVFENGRVTIDWENYDANSVVHMKDLGYAIGDCRK